MDLWAVGSGIAGIIFGGGVMWGTTKTTMKSVENQLNEFVKKEVCTVCQSKNDLHFKSQDEKLEAIKSSVDQVHHKLDKYLINGRDK